MKKNEVKILLRKIRAKTAKNILEKMSISSKTVRIRNILDNLDDENRKLRPAASEKIRNVFSYNANAQ